MQKNMEMLVKNFWNPDSCKIQEIKGEKLGPKKSQRLNSLTHTDKTIESKSNAFYVPLTLRPRCYSYLLL